VAAGFGAHINILDVNMDRLRYLNDIMPPNVTCLYSDRHTVRQCLRFALCNVTLPWALRIAERGLDAAAESLPPVAHAVNIHRGSVTNRAVAETFSLPYHSRFER